MLQGILALRGVVEPFDAQGLVASGLIVGAVDAVVDQLALRRAEGSFYRCIAVLCSQPVHTDLEVVLFRQSRAGEEEEVLTQ
jgi:hypothetical protein